MKCNFSAIKIYFQKLKKEYDPWFMIFINIFENFEELIMKLDEV